MISDVLGKYAHIQPWLRDCYLGYGELMGEAESVHKCFDFHDTFLSSEHLLESFPDKKIKFVVDEVFFLYYKLTTIRIAR